MIERNSDFLSAEFLDEIHELISEIDAQSPE
jgi:hypothetical protein